MRLTITLAIVLVLGHLRLLAADEKVEIMPDVVYGHKFGLALTMDMYRPKADANGAAVLFMVSGGWHSRWFPPERGLSLFRPLLEKGFTVFAVRHGSSPKFNIPEAVADVRRSVRFVRHNAGRFEIDPDRIGVYGGSAGGHLSLMLGTTSDDGQADASDEVLRESSRIAVVVAYFPPTDLRKWVSLEENRMNKSYPALRFDAKKGGDYSPLLHVTKDDAPTLLIHGDQDKLVTLDHSENIQEAFDEKKVQNKLIVIKGAAHGFRGDDAKQAAEAMVAWFEKYLSKRTDE